MKALLVILISLCCQQTIHLNGTYIVVYDKGQQGYQMTFGDSIYIQKMPDAVTTRGIVSYGKYKVMLRKTKDDNPIEIDNREIGKDTIKFITRSQRDLSMALNRGKMIKIK